MTISINQENKLVRGESLPPYAQKIVDKVSTDLKRVIDKAVKTAPGKVDKGQAKK